MPVCAPVRESKKARERVCGVVLQGAPLATGVKLENCEWRPFSVWDRDDASLLEWMIPFYLRQRPSSIADVTYGRGRFWKNSSYSDRLIRMDGEPSVRTVIKRDFAKTGLGDRSLDVVVFDPPHISENDTPRASRLVRSGMGFGSVEKAADVTALFPGFLREAWRILRADGVVLCKISDQVHRGRSRWQHVSLMLEAERRGFMVCDLIVKVRRMALMGAWKRALHARKVHAFWIVLRKGRC